MEKTFAISTLTNGACAVNFRFLDDTKMPDREGKLIEILGDFRRNCETEMAKLSLVFGVKVVADDECRTSFWVRTHIRTTGDYLQFQFNCKQLVFSADGAKSVEIIAPHLGYRKW